MGEDKQRTDLQLEPDLAHERIEWRVQRIGWLGLALFCAAALAGLLGPGPASRQTAGQVGSPLHLEFDRFLRQRAPFALKIFCNPDDSADQFILSLDRSWVERAEITKIQPEPATVSAAGNQYLYQFNSSGADEQLVTIHFEPDTFGEISTSLSLNAKDTLHFKQFVWP